MGAEPDSSQGSLEMVQGKKNLAQVELGEMLTGDKGRMSCPFRWSETGRN